MRTVHRVNGGTFFGDGRVLYVDNNEAIAWTCNFHNVVVKGLTTVYYQNKNTAVIKRCFCGLVASQASIEVDSCLVSYLFCSTMVRGYAKSRNINFTSQVVRLLNVDAALFVARATQ